MKERVIKFIVLISLLVFSSINVFAGTISISLGSYESEIYKQETVNLPVTITASNISGTVNVILTPKDGVSCDSCTLSVNFNGVINEQQTATFTLTGTKTGTYNPPFVSISASSGSTQATPLSLGNAITVLEKPMWTKSFSVDDNTLNVDDQTVLTLTINPSGGSFSGVSADLVLPSGVSLISGSDPRNIGTISGEASYQWIVKATNSGTKNIQVKLSASTPQESASNNIESLSLIISEAGDNEESDSPASGGSGGAGGGGGGSGDVLQFGNLTPGGVMLPITNGNYSFTEITLNVNEAINNVKLFIEKKTNVGQSYPVINGTIYQYLVLSSSQLTNQNLKGGEVRLKVDNKWISDNKFDKNRIFLLRYNGNNWIEEPITRLYSEQDYSYYKSQITYLGTFAIAYLPPKNLDYLRLSDLTPELIDLNMVIESGLADSVMIDRLEAYFFSKMNLKKTIEQSQELVKFLEIKREVANGDKFATMTVTIKNNKNEPVEFMFVEAVPKTIVHDVYALKDFIPRKYDLIIREDPVIQWSFGEADTSVVAWEVKNLNPGEVAKFTYSLDANVDLLKYPAPIIVKPMLVSDMVEAAEEISNTAKSEASISKAMFGKFSIWLSVFIILAIIGVLSSMYISRKEKYQKTNINAENKSIADIKSTHKIKSISEYIEKQKVFGKNEETIRSNLKSVGWKEGDINEAFEKCNK